MTAGNPAAGSLFRSLGADDAYFETRARAASKEAEQRWPLFKAVAPNKAEETPVLSEQQRQTSWTPPPAAALAAKAPRLSRPGLSQKLASGLRELGQKTKNEVAAAGPSAERQSPLARNLRGALPSTEASSKPALPAQSQANSTPVPPPLFRPTAASASPVAAMRAIVTATPVEPPHPKSSKFLGNFAAESPSDPVARKKTAPHAAPTETTVKGGSAKKGLFAQLAPTHEQPSRDTTLAGRTRLQSVFARLTADTAAPEAATKQQRGTLFGRIGR